MSRNSLFCEAHIHEATLFCLCGSDPLYICPTCLPKHEGHDLFPIAQSDLFLALGKDKTELKRRNDLSRGCQTFLDRVMEREAAVQSEAKVLLNSVNENYEMLLEGNHRCFESLFITLREEAAVLLTRPKFRVSPITQKLLEKLDSLGPENEKRFAHVPELETLRRVTERCQEACSRVPKVWQSDYEEEVLQTLINAQLTEQEKETPSEAALVSLNLKLKDTMRQLETLRIDFEVKEKQYVSLEMEKQTLSRVGLSQATELRETKVALEKILNDIAEANKKTATLETRLTTDPPSESQEPIPDYCTPESRAILARLGPYSDQDDELMLIKRGPVYENNESYKGVYIGQWNTRNEKHGYGKFLSQEGDITEGQWRKDTSHGSVRVITSKGHVYIGNFVQSKIEGFGTFYFTNGDEYSGTWVNGKKHGIGSFKFGAASQSPADRYIGEYFENQQQGIGAKFWADGKMYVGSWRSGAMYGKGVMTWPDGSIYCGGFDSSGRSGAGCYIWPDGNVYKGEWKGGKKSGSGRLTHPGEFEEGVWVEDVLAGKGAKNQE